jgi:hypothetical protein
VTTDLERSHDELRAALIVAGRQIRKFRYAKGSVRALSTLRKVLTDARQVRKTKQAYGTIVPEAGTSGQRAGTLVDRFQF